MKLSTRLRRPSGGPGGPGGPGDHGVPPGTDGPPSPPVPPRGSPVAAYAGILDGHTLWLALEPVAGVLALRDDAGEVHPLHSDLPEQDPAYRSVRADLLDLPGEDECAYDVVVVPPGGRPLTVWTAPFARTPMRTPPAPGDAWQLGLVRTDDGMLRVRRTRPEPGCDVLGIDLTETGVQLTLAAHPRPGRTEPALLALEEDEVVATYPVTHQDEVLVATITEAGLPEGRDQLLRWGLGSPDSWVPLRRSANDLANPNAAVLLPVLNAAGSDEHRLRMRYAPDATLLARVVDPATVGGEA